MQETIETKDLAIYAIYSAYQWHVLALHSDRPAKEKEMLTAAYMADFTGISDAITVIVTGDELETAKYIRSVMETGHPTKDNDYWPEFLTAARAAFDAVGVSYSPGAAFNSAAGEMSQKDPKALKTQNTGFHGWKGGRMK